MKKRFLLLIVFSILFSYRNYATHIVGGEIYYDYLGGGNYFITLKIYRDCSSPTNAGFDPNAYVFVYDYAGNFVDSLAIPLPGSTILPPLINNPCFTPPADVCVEEGIYQDTINLPPIPGGYYISYHRCCRNGTIINLDDPGGTGSIYMAHIPDPIFAAVNNTPRYNNFPPIFICAGVPLTFDHSATDPDGDSLYYQFCDPFNTSGECALYGAPAASLVPPCPELAPPQPYSYVNFLPPYSASYPMSAFPAMSINPVTGLLTGTPNMLGQYVVGVCVSEYRNGVLLSTNKRDFQFNVVDCPGLPVASIPQQTTFCTGMTVNFSQNSLNAMTSNWYFGDPSTTADVSTAQSPSWTYPAAGTYTVTLVINQGQLCTDTNTITYSIAPLLAPAFTAPPPECLESNSFNFNAGGAFAGTGTFNWNFGTNASPASSASQNPSNVTFNAPGTYPVTLIVNENGCADTVIHSVQVFPKPIADFGLTSPISCILNPVQFNDSSISTTPLTYQWNFDDGNTSTLQNPVNTYSVVDTYNVTLIVTTTQGCKDTVELPAPLNVLPPPAASFTMATNCFTNEIDFTQTSTGGSTSLWNFGDLTTTADSSNLYSPSYTYPDSGSYTVVLTVNPGTSCTGVQTTTFFVDPPLIPTLSPASDCFAANSFNFTPGGSYEGNGTFSWNFGSHASPSSSTNGQPANIVYDTVGTFPVTVNITENGCTATCSTLVSVYPEPEARFEIATTTNCALNPVHFMDDSQSDTPLTYSWDFGDGSTSTAQNPYTTYAAGGFYNVSLVVTSQQGCKDTALYPSPIEIFPSPIAGFNVSPTYTSIFYPDVVMTDLSSGADSCGINWGDGYISSNCDSMHTYTYGGTFGLMQVVVNNFGCYDTAYAEVIIDPNYLFWIPNAFTPADHNGLNDVFKPKLIGVHSYSFMIFDRWGEKIFETDKLEVGWDGLYKDVLCQQDVYVYRVSFRDDVKGVYHKYIGSVTLVR